VSPSGIVTLLVKVTAREWLAKQAALTNTSDAITARQKRPAFPVPKRSDPQWLLGDINVRAN
jgi:hypothetical protein